MFSVKLIISIIAIALIGFVDLSGCLPVFGMGGIHIFALSETKLEDLILSDRGGA
jgi:hypothetical protein